MAHKNKKIISSFYGDAKDAKKSPELVMREAFLRTSKETLDNFGVENFALDQIRGAMMMLEKYIEIQEE